MAELRAGRRCAHRFQEVIGDVAPPRQNPSVVAHPSQKILAGTDHDVGEFDALAFHENPTTRSSGRESNHFIAVAAPAHRTVAAHAQVVVPRTRGPVCLATSE